MAETTTAVNACDVVVSLDNSAGTLADISGSSNAVSMEFSIDNAEYRVFGSKWLKRMSCVKDGSFSLTVVYTTTDNTEGLDLLKDWFMSNTISARTMQVDIPDSNTGSDRWSGEVRLENLSFDVEAEESGPIMVEASLLADGPWTCVTIGS